MRGRRESSGVAKTVCAATEVRTVDWSDVESMWQTNLRAGRASLGRQLDRGQRGAAGGGTRDARPPVALGDADDLARDLLLALALLPAGLLLVEVLLLAL